ncbi:DUF3800 domain-containing protein [Chryseobacterium bernardetii]|uniref:DUF3800 domain-containing protein n=1 Tax=Chryseobacterium bernardetii TaxID=1241978 RepID=UPI003AF60C67
MNKIYFDEAGNTGADLLNKDQNVFVLCSNNYTREEAYELIKLFKNREELHFVKLKNSEAGRKSVINFLNHPLISENRIILYAADKEFVAIAQIVSQLIETFYYKNGMDLHRDNNNIVITQLIYFLSKSSWNKAQFQKLLNQFITMFRVRDEQSIKLFYNLADEFYDKLNTEDKPIFFPIVGSKIYIMEILNYADKFTLDVTFSCFIALCGSWYNKIGQKFDVIVDNSKQLEHYLDFISTLQNLDIPEKKIGYGSRTITFPLQVNEIKLTNSEDEINIQLSDIIASSLAFIFNNKNEKHQKFVEQIKDSKILNLKNTMTLGPNTYENSNIEYHGEGENILDFFEKHFSEKQK